MINTLYSLVIEAYNNGHIENDMIVVEGMTIDVCNIPSLYELKNVIFRNVIFTNTLDIHNLEINNVIFEQCKFESTVDIIGGSIDKLKFDQCNIYDLIICNTAKINELTFINNLVLRSHFYNCTIDNYIMENNYWGTFYVSPDASDINKGEIKDNTIATWKITELVLIDVNITNNKVIDVDFDNITFKDCNIDGLAIVWGYMAFSDFNGCLIKQSNIKEIKQRNTTYKNERDSILLDKKDVDDGNTTGNVNHSCEL